MLGTLEFTGAEHWAPFTFPQSTALFKVRKERALDPYLIKVSYLVSCSINILQRHRIC